MSKALAVLYIAFVVALIASAVGILRIRCEGFGCTGVGIAWAAWVAVFVPSLVLGFVLRTKASLGALLAKTVVFAFWLQVVMAGALLALWIIHQVG